MVALERSILRTTEANAPGREVIGKHVTVRAATAALDGRAAVELRSAERLIAALEELLQPPPSARGARVTIILREPDANSIGAEMAWLECATGERWDLDAETIIGRGRESTIRFDDPNVSRQHAMIRRGEAGYSVVDLASTHGTLLNGEAIATPRLLRPGNRLTFAGVELIFRATGPASSLPSWNGSAIAHALRADAPDDLTLARPLTELLVARWFGTAAITAAPIIIGLAGLAVAQARLGPTVAEADATVRAALIEGKSIGIVVTPATTPVGSESGTVSDAAAHSFVAYLRRRFGAVGLRTFLESSDPERSDAAALAAFERPLGALEEEWRAHLQRQRGDVTRAFLHHIVPLLRPHWRRQVEVAIILTLELAASLALPLVTRHLIDVVVPQGNLRGLALFSGLLLIAFLAESVFGLRRVYTSAAINQRIQLGLRERMFDRLLALSHDFYARSRVGDLLARLTSDLGLVGAALGQLLGSNAASVIRAIAAAVTILALSIPLGVALLLALPIFGLAYTLILGRIGRDSRTLQRLQGEIASVQEEQLAAHALVKALGLEGRAGAAHRTRLLAALRVILRLNLTFGIFETSIGLATTIGQLAVLSGGGLLVIRGQVTIGTLLALIGLLPALFAPIALFADVGQSIQRATGGLDRITELLDEPIAIADKPGAIALPPLERAIRLEKVTFAYDGTQPILRDLNLTIPVGRHTAIVGPSGAGKSTIASLLLRFYDPTAGRVVFDDHDLRDLSVASLREQIGLVFQDTFVFNTTIRENIAIGRPGATDAAVAAAAHAAQLDGYIASLPAGLDTILGERGVRMSGGQRQRLAIARALLRDPRLLILDEATSALDAATEREIVRTLGALIRGRTTVSITHRLSLAAAADQIVVIDQGRIVEQGSHTDLLRASGLYSQLHAEQGAAAGD